MKCEQCSQPAIVHLTDIEQGTATFRHLCREHARGYAATEDALSLRSRHVGRAGWETSILDRLLAERVPVTVEVTQEQVDNEQIIDVALPDGRSERVRVPKDLTQGMAWFTLRPASPGKVYALQFRLASQPRE